MKLRTDFADRQTMIDYLREQFPSAVDRSPEVSPMRGGRRAAEELLQQINPTRYAATRNQLNGAVTRLSAYLRHGILSLSEVRLFALQREGARAEKLVTELGWRDYWQRVYRRIGTGIWEDRELGKTGWTQTDYAANLPDEISEGRSGLECIDHFVRELRQTGYLHNHARMWIAAWVVHFRRIRWQAGAAWFLEHLLDGDPASNNLSWQWVAGTFSSKPYYFNRENLEQFSDGVHCQNCRLASSGCPFEGSYEDLRLRLFPHMPMSEEGRS